MTVIGHGYDDNVGAPAFRNVIINGNMSVAQRGTSSAAVGAAYYTADRWRTDASFGSCTQSIQNDAPIGSGLTKSLKMLVGVGASATTYDSIHINQKIEGQNLEHLCFGQASAKSITISFWVKSNVTGTYIFHINTNNSNRQYSSSYTISASGVWEKKSITITGDTVTAIVNNNTEGLRAYFVLSAGSFYANGAPDNVWANRGAPFWTGQTNFASATNNYWQITGVQLEAGSVATPFEFEPYETTLRKCQRYYYLIASNALAMIGDFHYYNATEAYCTVRFPIAMRAAPVGITTSGTSYFQINRAGGTNAFNAITDWTYATPYSVRIGTNGASGTAGQSGHGMTSNAASLIAASAEL